MTELVTCREAAHVELGDTTRRIWCHPLLPRCRWGATLVAPTRRGGTVFGVTTTHDMPTSHDMTAQLDDLASPGQWVFEGYDLAMRSAQVEDWDRVTQVLSDDLMLVAESATEGLDADDALRTCFLLGATVAAIYKADLERAAGRIPLLEAVVVLHDTIEGLRLDMPEIPDGLERSATRMLSRIAAMPVDDIEVGDHYGDLMIAAAACIAHLRYSPNSTQGS